MDHDGLALRVFSQQRPQWQIERGEQGQSGVRNGLTQADEGHLERKDRGVLDRSWSRVGADGAFP